MTSIEDLIAGCRAALRKPDPARAVEAIVRDFLSDLNALQEVISRAAFASPDCAEYVFLHQSTDLTVLHATLPALLCSPPHNHLAWAVVGMYEGRESHVFYGHEGDGLREVGRRELVAPGVLVLAADAIHGIANPDDKPSRALHVYGGNLANPARSLWNPFSMKEEPFQLSAIARYERELTQAVRSQQS